MMRRRIVLVIFVFVKISRDAKSTEEIKSLLQEFITNHFPSVQPEVQIF